ncbi:thiamine-phosphate kinase [Oceanobacillus neutriphilus]|uniref:Thiamine-monophosphate kinase n=1 Tax=Oceanobacillus neutriphilus TaxID=531815 RepID=A0ABQ2P2K2_9BACI|nr:thiamine-phosphate kinase [Oceanobacillus neutriphilus]GGP16716.1 thiamine-monophosphate kinase [Oceanobacillus neutriphilus]
MDEFSFINAIKPKAYNQPTLIKGIGDDAAVFRSTSDVVTTVDTFVEDIHFSLETMEPFHIGYRVLAANISDLAAMGAKPAFYLVSMCIPKKWNQEALEGIYQGMNELASMYQMDLIGGDTVSSDRLMISITAMGYVSKERARYRSHARPGDIIFATGTLGDSRAGLEILLHQQKCKDKDYYIKRHRLPQPRAAFALGLREIERVALNDISDGISNEANEIAEASGVELIIIEEKIPVSQTFHQFSEKQQYEWKLSGGEDFELLGTVSKQEWARVQEIAYQENTPIKQIGYVRESDEPRVLIQSQEEVKQLTKSGYTHLK